MCGAALGQSSGFSSHIPQNFLLSLTSVRGLFSPELQNNQQSAIGEHKRENWEGGERGREIWRAVQARQAPCPLPHVTLGSSHFAFPAKVAPVPLALTCCEHIMDATFASARLNSYLYAGMAPLSPSSKTASCGVFCISLESPKKRKGNFDLSCCRLQRARKQPGGPG